MGTFKAEGVSFTAFWRDHPPPHIHAFLAETRIIIDLLEDGNVRLSARKDAVSRRAKKSHVDKMLRLAAENREALITLAREAEDAR